MTIADICALIMTGCAVFNALFEVYKYRHHHPSTGDKK